MHTHEECPHTSLDWDEQPEARLDRPNHYYHDVLGCPFECTARHNHPLKA